MAELYPMRAEGDIPIQMRDGTITRADVYRPDATGRFPVLLCRTPYDKTSARAKVASMDVVRAVMYGYAVVLQDVRGRYASDGEFNPFFNEIDDGYDSVGWAASQPWSSGKVGMFGDSYVGATQWLAAISRPPALAAIVPGVTASDYHEGWTWQGGAFELGFNLNWALHFFTIGNYARLSRTLDLPPGGLDKLIDAVDDNFSAFEYLPLKEWPDLKPNLAPYYYDWLDHPEYDDYWKKVCIEEKHAQIDTPAFNYGGWYDIFLGGTIRNFGRMREMGATERARQGQRLLIGPWVHGGAADTSAGDQFFGVRSSGAYLDLDGAKLSYYDHMLKDMDNGVGGERPVRIFVMGDNVWRYEDEWPLSRAQPTRYFLHSRGKANSLNGDGSLDTDSPNAEPPDIFAYNPADPVPTHGGGLCCYPSLMPWGAYDQRCIEARSDVLVYSTPPLWQDTEVTGPVTVSLYAASSACDTDFTAKLVDVEPCGRARNLTDGIIRARYRKPRSPAELIEPGQVHEYTIDLWATSNVFKKGHQIRLEISSSNFPRFDRNTNTGNPIGEDAGFVPALQTVLHDDAHPSCVTLHIVPGR